MEINKILIIFFLILFTSCLKKTSVNREMKDVLYTLQPFKANDNNDELLTFKLVISEKKPSGKITDYYKPANYNKLIYYVNMQISSDFNLTHGNETISPIMVHFEPNMKLTNTMVVLVAFEKIKLYDDCIFVFNDNLFNNGKIKFSINEFKI